MSEQVQQQQQQQQHATPADPSTTPPAIEKHTCQRCDAISTALNAGLAGDRFTVWHSCQSGRPTMYVKLRWAIGARLDDPSVDVRKTIAAKFRDLADHVEKALADEGETEGAE